MNALITKLLHLRMKHRHVAVAHNPFWVFLKLRKIQLVDDSYRSISSSRTKNGVDVVSVEIVLHHAGTEVVIPRKLVILNE